MRVEGSSPSRDTMENVIKHRWADPKYKSNVKPKRKDNGQALNLGSGGFNGHSVRVPSKKRKTAWKRFWKLFPKYNKT